MANNIVAFNPLQVPAYARAESSALNKALSGGGFSGKRVSIKGGVFRLIAGGKEIAQIEDRYLDVVVVAAAPKIGRTWYAKKWDGEASQGPSCWSADGDTPNADAANKQSETCAACPQNVKGSGEGHSRACRYSQRVAVVLANDIEGDVMQLQLPAQSIFGDAEGDNMPLHAYVRYLDTGKINIGAVITRMKFDTAAESPKLFFKAMRYLSQDEVATAVQKGATSAAKVAITMTVAAFDSVGGEAFQQPTKPARPVIAAPDEDVETPPYSGHTLPAAKTKGRKKVEPEAEAPIAEPKVREKPPSSVPNNSLADIAANWATDD